MFNMIDIGKGEFLGKEIGFTARQILIQIPTISVIIKNFLNLSELFHKINLFFTAVDKTLRMTSSKFLYVYNKSTIDN